MPILNWGAISAAVKTAKSKHRQNILAYKQSVVEALADVETKIHNKLTSKNNLLIQQEALATAQQIFDLASARHKAGVINDLALQEALQNFCATQQQKLVAEKSDAIAAIALAKSLGGG